MFFLLPVGVDYRARRYPVVTFTLMGIWTLVYLVTLTCQAFGDYEEVQRWVYQNLWLVPKESHWWMYVTGQFVHQDIFHLGGYMVYVFLFGSCVEDIIGRPRYILFYLLCGLIADFSFFLASPDHFKSEIPMGGASGAISGCIGGFLLLLAKSKIQFRYFILFFFRFYGGAFMAPAWLVISLWFLKDAAMMVLTMMADETGGGVAFGAHVGGTLAGMGLIAIEKVRLKRNGLLESLDEEEDDAPITTPAARARLAAAQPDARAQLAAQPIIVPVAERATIFLSWDGAHYGPYGMSQIRRMFQGGRIPPSAHYWQEGMDGWRAAEELREPGYG